MMIEAHGFEGCLRKPVSKFDLIRVFSRFLKYSTPDEAAAPAGKPVDVMKIEEISKLPEIIEKLENELMPRWNGLKKMQPVDEVKKFGNDIKDLGEAGNVEIVTKLGEDLLFYLDSFDIENMRKTLAEFPEFIDKLKSLENCYKSQCNS